jgi:phosphoglucomutase
MFDVDGLMKDISLLESTCGNIRESLSCDAFPSWTRDSVIELLEKNEYTKLNDYSFKTSEFRMGGIRGRTVGKVLTKTELGNSHSDIPQHASTESVFVNNFNVIRMIVALFKQCMKYLNDMELSHKFPCLVIAYHTRFFAKHCSELCASIWFRLGGHVMSFDGRRSTPELRFSVRLLQAIAEVKLAVSHNP